MTSRLCWIRDRLAPAFQRCKLPEVARVDLSISRFSTVRYYIDYLCHTASCIPRADGCASLELDDRLDDLDKPDNYIDW